MINNNEVELSYRKDPATSLAELALINGAVKPNRGVDLLIADNFREGIVETEKWVKLGVGDMIAPTFAAIGVPWARERVEQLENHGLVGVVRQMSEQYQFVDGDDQGKGMWSSAAVRERGVDGAGLNDSSAWSKRVRRGKRLGASPKRVSLWNSQHRTEMILTKEQMRMSVAEVENAMKSGGLDVRKGAILKLADKAARLGVVGEEIEKTSVYHKARAEADWMVRLADKAVEMVVNGRMEEEVLGNIDKMLIIAKEEIDKKLLVKAVFALAGIAILTSACAPTGFPEVTPLVPSTLPTPTEAAPATGMEIVPDTSFAQFFVNDDLGMCAVHFLNQNKSEVTEIQVWSSCDVGSGEGSLMVEGVPFNPESQGGVIDENGDDLPEGYFVSGMMTFEQVEVWGEKMDDEKVKDEVLRLVGKAREVGSGVSVVAANTLNNKDGELLNMDFQVVLSVPGVEEDVNGQVVFDGKLSPITKMHIMEGKEIVSIDFPSGGLEGEAVFVTMPSDWVKIGSEMMVSEDVVKIQEDVAKTAQFTLIPNDKTGLLEIMVSGNNELLGVSENGEEIVRSNMVKWLLVYPDGKIMYWGDGVGQEVELDTAGLGDDELRIILGDGQKLTYDVESDSWMEVVQGPVVGEDGLVHLINEEGLGISYNPEKMYDGLVEINPEMAELLRERYIGVIWARNNLVKNANFEPGGKYETFEKFLEAANEGEVSGVCQFESYGKDVGGQIVVQSICREEKVTMDLREIELKIPVIRITNQIPDFSEGSVGLVPVRGKYGATQETIDPETNKLTVRLIIKLPGEVNPDLPPDKLIMGLTKAYNDVFSTIIQPDAMGDDYKKAFVLLDGRIALSHFPPDPDAIGIDANDLLMILKNPNILNDSEQIAEMGLKDEMVERMRRFVLGDVFLSTQ